MEERLGEMRKGRRERIEKGSHCFFKSSGYDKLELNHKNLVFFKLIECIIKKKIMSWCEAVCNKTLGRAQDPRAKWCLAKTN